MIQFSYGGSGHDINDRLLPYLMILVADSSCQFIAVLEGNVYS